MMAQPILGAAWVRSLNIRQWIIPQLQILRFAGSLWFARQLFLCPVLHSSSGQHLDNKQRGGEGGTEITLFEVMIQISYAVLTNGLFIRTGLDLDQIQLKMEEERWKLLFFEAAFNGVL